MGDKRQGVWLDSCKIPVMFRAVEDGTPIDFMLQNAAAAADSAAGAPSKRDGPAPADAGGK